MEHPPREWHAPDGLVAEGLRRGLQILVRGFDSLRGLHPIPERQSMVDFAQARRMMVDSQLRTFDVNDVRLLDVMESIPRELFVLPGRENLAYIDQNIPVSDGAERRCMLSPMVLARMIQALEIVPGMKVLDVACGLGYSSAVLAELGATVVAIDSDETLTAAASKRLASAG